MIIYRVTDDLGVTCLYTSSYSEAKEQAARFDGDVHKIDEPCTKQRVVDLLNIYGMDN